MLLQTPMGMPGIYEILVLISRSGILRVTYLLKWPPRAYEFYLIRVRNDGSSCDYGTLDKNKVKGKIVYCLGNGGQDYTIKELGGAGAIMVLDAMTDIAYTFLVPGTLVIPKDGKKIEHYINTTK